MTATARPRVLLRSFATAVAVFLFLIAPMHAQDSGPQQVPSPPNAETGPATDSLPVFFPHPSTDRWWISGQVNIVSQWHPAFTSPYSGRNSFSAQAQDASSRVLTLYTGLRLTRSMELLCDVQETGGHGLGEALGLAGFTNLDVVRNPSLGKAPYIARLMWHQIFSLSRDESDSARTPFSLFNKLPDRRLELRFGKFGMADFFDLNSYGSDGNFQFMDWTVDNNGAYDYAADTRGYTFGAILEYHDGHGAVRFAEALMPKVANGIYLDADVSRERAENMELELRGSLMKSQEGILRLLAYVNHANMGNYRQAVQNFEADLTARPEITAHPFHTASKYGFGANFEQPLKDWFGIFGRCGWDEGRHESYAYTEVDSTVEFGAGASGRRWHRKFDRAGLVFVTNGISRDHQKYLALGGYGFLLGDGRLSYGRETIEEAYYTVHLWRGAYPSVGVQHINNPGYNRDRGPVLVPTARLHLEF